VRERIVEFTNVLVEEPRTFLLSSAILPAISQRPSAFGNDSFGNFPWNALYVRAHSSVSQAEGCAGYFIRTYFYKSNPFVNFIYPRRLTLAVYT